jgi:hypothetical protein
MLFVLPLAPISLKALRQAASFTLMGNALDAIAAHYFNSSVA